jgi:hypothetical protein
MNDEKRYPVWHWPSLAAGIASWAVWKFSHDPAGFPTPAALVGATVFFGFNLAFAFRVARRSR